MIIYLRIQKTITAYGCSEFSYGIKVVRGRRCVRIIQDITDDRARIDRLIDDLNSLSLDPIHLDEVIEDFLLE